MERRINENEKVATSTTEGKQFIPKGTNTDEQAYKQEGTLTQLTERVC